MEQCGTDTYLVKPVQRYERQIETLDLRCRSSMHLPTRKAPLPPPLNYCGVKGWRAPPPEARSCVPAGISGVYRYEGPLLEPYGIVPKKQIPNLV